MNLSMKENRLMGTKGQTCGCQAGRQKEGTEVSRCQVLSVYIGQINSKVLLQSTGNYIEYDNHNRKECKKESVCMYIYI